MNETFLESHGLATALVVVTVLVAALAEWLVTLRERMQTLARARGARAARANDGG